MDKYYSVLKIKKGASQEEIRQAYRKQALLNHPDRHVDGDQALYTEKFQEIGEAYAKLSKTPSITLSGKSVNPYEIFFVFFPDIDFESEETQEMINNFIESNAMFEVPKQIWNSIKSYNIHKNLIKKKAKTLEIDYPISLYEQYKSNTTEFVVKLKKRSIAKTTLVNYNKTITLNLLNKKNVFTNIGNFDLENEFSGDLIVNIIDKPDDNLRRYKDFDLVYNLIVDKNEFFNGFHKKISFFNENLYIYISNPWKNSIYLLENYGMIDYSDNYKGDLYINLKVDPKLNNNEITITNQNILIPISVDIFRES